MDPPHQHLEERHRIPRKGLPRGRARRLLGAEGLRRHRGRCGQESVYTNLFLGNNNWPAIRAALDKVHYDGWIIAEMEAVYKYAPDQQFYDTAAAMDRFIHGRM